MKLIIDSDQRKLIKDEHGQKSEYDLYSKEAFELISDLWLKVGWHEKYTYTFSWMGRPIIQLPEDMIRLQEVIYHLKPDIIVETGVAHGGSLIFYASLFKAMGQGRVIGIDIEIRPHNQKAIEDHELASFIKLIQGSSTDKAVVKRVRSLIKPTDKVLVILDSNHSRKHVLDELKAYCDVVTAGSYIVATDGLLRDVSDTPRGAVYAPDGDPTQAVKDFLKDDDRFILEQPSWPFNESRLDRNVTHWPMAWLRRK